MDSLSRSIVDETTKLNLEQYAGNLGFRRNHKSYELTSYMNHAIAFFYAGNWEGMTLFTTRAAEFLKQNEHLVAPGYCDQAHKCLELFSQHIENLRSGSDC